MQHLGLSHIYPSFVRLNNLPDTVITIWIIANNLTKILPENFQAKQISTWIPIGVCYHNLPILPHSSNIIASE